MDSQLARFLVGFALFFAVLSIALALVNEAYVRLVFEKKQPFRKEEMYREYVDGLPGRRIGIAFFGSSHTGAGVNPAYIPGAYNLATTGENYIKTYYKLRRMLRGDNVTIGVAVFELDPATFSSLLLDDSQYHDLYLLKDYMSLREMADMRGGTEAEAFVESRFPVIGRGDEFKYLVKRPEATDLRLGWINNSGRFSDSNMSAAAGFDYDTEFKGREILDSRLLDYLGRTVRMASDSGARVVFVEYPVAQEYIDVLSERGFPRDRVYDEAFRRINSTIGEYYVLDYFGLYANRTEYFADSNHLNEEGAAAFSARLNEDLGRLNLVAGGAGG